MHAGLAGGNWLSYTSISLAGSPRFVRCESVFSLERGAPERIYHAAPNHVVFPHSKMEPRKALRPIDTCRVLCVGQGSLRNGLAEQSSALDICAEETAAFQCNIECNTGRKRCNSQGIAHLSCSNVTFIKEVEGFQSCERRNADKTQCFRSCCTECCTETWHVLPIFAVRSVLLGVSAGPG